MKNNQKHFPSYLEAVQQALIKEWDPIGVGAIPEAQDEYGAYAPKIAEMLLAQKPRKEVLDYLWWLETEQIGLTGNRDATEKFADRLMQIAAALSSQDPQ
jgi:hypothetical protein